LFKTSEREGTTWEGDEPSCLMKMKILWPAEKLPAAQGRISMLELVFVPWSSHKYSYWNMPTLK
jgi:hypothetical protein